MKKVKYIVIPLCALVIFLFALKAHGEINVVSPLINIETPLHYLSASDMKNKIYEELQKNRYEDNILSLIEDNIQSNPWVDKANVYMTVDGNIKINVAERIPTLRIFTPWQNTFYIDNKLHKMPAFWVEKALTNVLIGYPSNHIDTPLLSYLNQWIKTIQKNEVLSQHFSHFNYLNKKQVEIVPIAGTPVAIVSIEQNPEKIGKQLSHFYTTILPQVGWDYYKSIDFTFKNQVVANKNS